VEDEAAYGIEPCLSVFLRQLATLEFFSYAGHSGLFPGLWTSVLEVNIRRPVAPRAQVILLRRRRMLQLLTSFVLPFSERVKFCGVDGEAADAQDLLSAPAPALVEYFHEPHVGEPA